MQGQQESCRVSRRAAGSEGELQGQVGRRPKSSLGWGLTLTKAGTVGWNCKGWRMGRRMWLRSLGVLK